MMTAKPNEAAARIALVILASLAVITALHKAQNVLQPMVFALVLGVVASPLADKLSAYKVPRGLIAGALMALVLILIGATLLLVEPLLALLISEIPRLKTVAESWIDMASGLLRGLESISSEIEQTIGAEESEAATTMPSVLDALWLAPAFLSQLFIFVGTLFFFVLTRNDIYRGVSRYTDRLYTADRAVARYFAAVTLVNVGLGIATAVALSLAGVNYAMLWGLAAVVLNYILYLGPLFIIVGLTVSGLIQFHGAYAFLPPFLFLLINLAEANFVTPLIVGKRLAMNPLVVFLAIVFGLALWGPVGAIVALPVLLWFGVLLRPSDIFVTQTMSMRGALPERSEL